MSAIVKFETASLVGYSQQCDMQWFYDIHMRNMQYVCIGFKKKVIHSIELDKYTCVWLIFD